MAKEELKTNDEINENLVWDILDFMDASSLYPSVFNPQLINQRMQDMSLMNSGKVTEARVANALSNPKSSEKELLAISEALEYTSPSYKRIIEYISSLPAWDFTYYCKNIDDISSYKDKSYKKSLNIVKEFFEKFDHKNEFKTILKQLFREETFFGVLRKEGEKYTIQQLPGDYCLITGRWDYGILFDFNYIFFQQGGVNIEMFPPVFAKTYKNLFQNTKSNSYDPAINVDDRARSLWTLWGQCSPKDNFWAWKLQPQLITRIPYYAGLFPDFAIQDIIRGLQKNSYMAAAIKLVFGEVPMLYKEQKATIKDAIAINPKLLGEFMQLVKAAINSEVVRVTTAPLNNINKMEFESDNEIYSSWLHTTLGVSGINGNLLFSGETKANQTETLLSANIDEIISENIYPYFNSFLEYHINNELKERGGKYRFGFNLEGSNFYTDRKRRLDYQLSLTSLGIVNPQKIFASLGQNVFTAQAQLDEARINGWTDNLTPIISSFQQPGNTGRPQKDEDDLTESGSQTRSDGGNVSKIKSNK